MYIIGVDPGTTYCGIVIYNIDDRTFDIISIQHRLIDLSKSKYNIDNDNLLFPRLNKLYDIFVELFTEYDIYWLAIEAAFINRLRPAAYGPIVTSIYGVKKAFIDVYKSNNIVEYPPKTVKQVVAVDGSSNKDGMYVAVNNIKELQGLFDIDNISEHEIDATAIGYTFIKSLRIMPEILLLK